MQLRRELQGDQVSFAASLAAAIVSSKISSVCVEDMNQAPRSRVRTPRFALRGKMLYTVLCPLQLGPDILVAFQ